MGIKERLPDSSYSCRETDKNPMPSDFGSWNVEFNIPDNNVNPDANGLFCPMSHDIYEYIESLYED